MVNSGKIFEKGFEHFDRNNFVFFGGNSLIKSVETVFFSQKFFGIVFVFFDVFHNGFSKIFGDVFGILVTFDDFFFLDSYTNRIFGVLFVVFRFNFRSLLFFTIRIIFDLDFLFTRYVPFYSSTRFGF